MTGVMTNWLGFVAIPLPAQANHQRLKYVAPVSHALQLDSVKLGATRHNIFSAVIQVQLHMPSL